MVSILILQPLFSDRISCLNIGVGSNFAWGRIRYCVMPLPFIVKGRFDESCVLVVCLMSSCQDALICVSTGSQ
jgi:hypothetical protein